MHVLLIHQAFAGPDDPGGTRHYEFGQRLAAMGHSFTVVTSPYNYLTGETRSPVRSTKRFEVRIAPALPDRRRGFFWRSLAFLSFAMSSATAGLRVRSVDVVIGTSPPLFQAMSAWMIAAIRRCPFVLEIRDLWPDFAIELGVLRNSFLISVARLVENSLYRRADHIIVNSPAYRDYLLERGISESRISVVPNGVDTSLFDPERGGEEFRREHDLNGAFVVMYAGALGLANDLDCLLRAASRLRNERNIVFAIVGSGKELAKLQSWCQYGNVNTVRFVPAQAKHQMPRVLAAADVCVATLKNIPMFRTTYPNKVFDYMAAGRPTILAIDGAIREVVEASAGGLCVAPGDDKAMAEALVKLRDNLDLRKRMGGNARAYAAEHFDREAQARHFADVLTRMVGHGSCLRSDSRVAACDTMARPK